MTMLIDSSLIQQGNTTAVAKGYSVQCIFPDTLAALRFPYSAPQHVLTEYLKSRNNGDDTAYRC